MQIHFVCTGNTCRSPMAQAIVQDHASRRALDEVTATSSGFLVGGHVVNPHVVTVLGERSASVAGRLSVQMTRLSIESADLVVAMTSQHAHGIVGRFPGASAHVFVANHLARVLQPRRQTQSVTGWIDELDQSNPRRYDEAPSPHDIEDPVSLGVDAYRAVEVELSDFIQRLLSAAFPTHIL